MNIRQKLFSSYLTVIIVPLLLSSCLFFANFKKSIKKDQFEKLSIIADLKVQKIASIFDTIKDDIAVIQNSYVISSNLPTLIRFADDRQNPAYLKSEEMLDKRFSRQLTLKGLLDIKLANPEGKIVYSINKKHSLGKTVPYYSENVGTWRGEIWLSDTFRHDRDFSMLAVAPASDWENKFIGFIIFEVNMGPIFGLIQDTTGLGETGETAAAFLVAKSISDPIHRLHKGIEVIGSGNLDYEVATTAQDEIGQLSRSFYQMVHDLKKTTASRDELNNEIAERKQAEESLAAAKQIAEAASRTKSEFIANMSHELRTPLNAVIGFSQIMQEEYYGKLNEKQKDYVKDILDSGQHLLSLVNDILDLSKIEAGKMELNVSRVNLKEMLERSKLLLKEKAMDHSMRFELKISADVPETIDADERKLKQIIYNFLSNAFKFSHEKGEVIMEAKRISAKEIEISVTDNGAGISMEMQKKLFTPFERLDSKVSGTGLGLALCKRMVMLWGGKIGVVSPPEGKDKGSRFYCTIPA